MLLQVSRLAKTQEKPSPYLPGTNKLSVDCTPSVVEEYTLETERPQVSLYATLCLIVSVYALSGAEWIGIHP